MKKTLKTSIKDEVMRMIRRMPDNCSVEDIQYQLYVRQVVEKGHEDIERGRVIPHEEAKRRMRKWLKSRGLAAR